MVTTLDSLYHACTKLGYTIIKIGVWPGYDAFEIKLLTDGPEYECFVDLLIEMRLKGYIFTQSIVISDTHFMVKIVKG